MADLTRISAEVMELVVALLDFQDICNMRLVSRAISAKASHALVRSDYQPGSVVWTSPTQLKALLEKTGRGWRGCLMEGLTIVGVVEEPASPNATQPDTEASSEASLSQAFANLHRHAPLARLDSLALRVQRQTSGGHMIDSGHVRDWNMTWNTAASTYAATMRALASSGMPVLRLDLFCTDSPRCALACDRVAELLPDLERRLRPSLSTLTHLSIGLSDALATHCLPDYNPEEQPSRVLVNLLALCPLLTSLNIRWYNLADLAVNDQQNIVNATILRQLAITSTGRASLSGLRNCLLRGIYTTEGDLMACLQRTPRLQSLSLEEVHLVEGTFEPLFRHLTDADTARDLHEMHLDDLWELEAHLLFFARGEPHFPSTGAQKPHKMVWKAADRPKRIKYMHAKGRAFGSAAFNNWRRRRNHQYGPPNARGMTVPPQT